MKGKRPAFLDREDRQEMARGKTPSRAEEAREASATTRNMVKKAKSGKGTLTYTPKGRGR
jgi:hypothetical protein